MLKAGMAWNFAKYSKTKDFIDAESEAPENKRGLWADEDVIAPWEWRDARKEMGD